MIIKKILKKNNILKDIYKDEDCFIFGNGCSLKNYDLTKFSKKNIFSCGWLFLHKDYKYLNILADFEMHPGIFLPFWKNEYKNNFEFNRPNKIFKNRERLVKPKYFFTSLLNLPGLLKFKNIHYLYHFGIKKFDYKHIDPSQKFSLMENSLYAMIGIASFMGFKNIYLVGMDYLLDRPIVGHFYENFQTITDESQSEKLNKLNFFNFFQKKINFKLVISNSKYKSFLDTIEYKHLFNTQNENKSNLDIVFKDDLELLNKANLNYRIFD